MVGDAELKPRLIVVAGFDAESVEDLGERLGLDAGPAARGVRLGQTELSRLHASGDELAIGFDWPEIAVARALKAGRDGDAALSAWMREARAAIRHAGQGRARLFDARAASPELLDALLRDDDAPLSGQPAREPALVYAPAASAWVRAEPEAGALADALAEAAGAPRFSPEALTKEAFAQALDAAGRAGTAQARIDVLEAALSVCRGDVELLASAAGRVRERRSIKGRPAIRRALSAWRGVQTRMRRNKDLTLIRESGLFDADWYCERYPDVDPDQTDPALHYLLHGGHEGRPPGPDFDATAYMILNPDLRALGVHPLVHYLRRGRAEGRPAVTLHGRPLAAARSA